MMSNASAPQMMHMHASRSGPVLSNEIILAIKEREANPNLRTIIGVLQPSGSVGKFVAYWLGGLPQTVQQQIVSNAYDGLSDSELIDLFCKQADNVELTPATFVDSYFLPIYNAYEKEFKVLGVDDAMLQKVRLLKTAHTFSEVMVTCSLALINTILAKRKYPLIDIMTVHKDIYDRYQAVKSLDPELMKRLAFNNVHKKTKHYQHAADFIAKDLWPYKKRPSSRQLEQLVRRFRNNPSHKRIPVTEQDFIDFYDTKAGKALNYAHFLSCVDAAYKASVIERSGDIGYITGEEMVKVMFEMADRLDNTYLATQKFMRGFDYSLYDKLGNAYPTLQVQYSAFTTWDTKLFPEFDTNFVCALKYL